MNKPLILITNDDGYDALGIRSLTESLRGVGELFIVAPDSPRSAQSSALTVVNPIRAEKMHEESDLTIYKCSGTPVDCVKLALDQLVPRRPALLVSGINHGVNSSSSVIYSGTMGAAMEGALNHIPSIGFSLCCDHNPDADMSIAMPFATEISKKVLERGLPDGICLNVNIPYETAIKGVRIARQAMGDWTEEYICRKDPGGKYYYWLSGNFSCEDRRDNTTDEWALHNGYVSIVPTAVDLTAYGFINELKQWFV
ncbi:MAG: 5'/3'-nucleotidase SurE [Prevotellaceae bacterium]|jgi:5'-nucleotidase|nr:5'/3'-nucleotidase SurE [Prevotellaceae bacterium]